MQNRQTTFIHWLLALLFSALLAGFSYQGRLNWLSTTLTRFLTPLRFPATSSRLYLQQKINLLSQLPRQQQLITDLKKQNIQLQTQLLELQNLQEQNRHLRQLLDLPSSAQAPLQPARITGLSRFAYLNQGSSSHIKPGYAVVSGSALLGIIEKTQPHTSSVRLLTDSQIKLPAQTTRGQSGLVVFERQKLRLIQVSPQPPLKKDQAVFTQGSPLIPPNLLIGTIQEVQPAQNDIYQSAVLAPAVNPHTQLNVAIILYQLQS